MSAKQNKKQDADRQFALDGTEYEIDLSNHAVRSPEGTKDAVRTPKIRGSIDLDLEPRIAAE